MLRRSLDPLPLRASGRCDESSGRRRLGHDSRPSRGDPLDAARRRACGHGGPRVGRPPRHPDEAARRRCARHPHARRLRHRSSRIAANRGRAGHDHRADERRVAAVARGEPPGRRGLLLRQVGGVSAGHRRHRPSGRRPCRAGRPAAPERAHRGRRRAAGQREPLPRSVRERDRRDFHDRHGSELHIAQPQCRSPDRIHAGRGKPCQCRRTRHVRRARGHVSRAGEPAGRSTCRHVRRSDSGP